MLWVERLRVQQMHRMHQSTSAECWQILSRFSAFGSEIIQPKSESFFLDK